MHYEIERIKTLTHRLANPDREEHETYFVVHFWESKDLRDSGQPPHWIEDFHAQNHRLLGHPLGPLAEIDVSVHWTYHDAKNAGKRGDNRNPDYHARAHDGDPHGVLAHPAVAKLRSEIAARKVAR